MTFGAKIYNENGQIIIDDQLPTYVQYLSGTLTSLTYNSQGYYVYGQPDSTGWYRYDMGAPNGNAGTNPNFRIASGAILNADGSTTIVPPNFDLIANNALIFFNLPVGHWGMFSNWLGGKEDTSFLGWYSTSPSASYRILVPRTNLPNPSDFGMAIYNQNGECTWNHNSLLGFIAAGRSQLGINEVLTHPDGALWISNPLGFPNQYVPGSYDGTNSTLYSMAFRRISSSQITYQAYRSTTAGNNGAQYAQPIRRGVLVGRFL